MSPIIHQLEMGTKGASSPSSIFDGCELEDEMVSQFTFQWDDNSVDSFINKFMATPREGICFPANIQPHTPTNEGRAALKNDILGHFAETDDGISVKYGQVVCKDQGVASRFVTKLATLDYQPWVQAILAQGNPLPGKLAKVTVTVRNAPVDAISPPNTLFH